MIDDVEMRTIVRRVSNGLRFYLAAGGRNPSDLKLVVHPETFRELRRAHLMWRWVGAARNQFMGFEIVKDDQLGIDDIILRYEVTC